jgi:probable phosphoglycerate mutase
MKQIFVVTHAESVHHVEGRVGGWYDTPLTETGRRQAGQIAERLHSLLRKQEVELFSSDLLRASQTAEAIGARFSVTAVLMPALREMSHGVAEGQPQEWLSRNQVPPSEDDLLDYRGVIKGETRREVAARIYPALEQIAARDCETQIIVTHGFALTFIVAAWIDMPIETLGRVSFPVRSASITRLASDPYWRNRAVLSLGDVTHLTAAG